jgi:hypothetical protein
LKYEESYQIQIESQGKITNAGHKPNPLPKHQLNIDINQTREQNIHAVSSTKSLNDASPMGIEWPCPSMPHRRFSGKLLTVVEPLLPSVHSEVG